MPRQVGPELIIGRALCVAGPPAVGKSTFMRLMRDGASDALPPELGDVTRWTYASLKGGARKLGAHDGGQALDLVLHVDLAVFSTLQEHRLARLRGFLGAAGEVYHLTLWAPPEVLAARVDGRMQTRIERTARPRRVQRLRRAKLALVGDSASFDSLYDGWFRLTSEFPNQGSWWVDSTTPDLVVAGADPLQPLSVAALRNAYGVRGLELAAQSGVSEAVSTVLA